MSTVGALSTGLELHGKSQGLGKDSFVVWYGGICCVKTSYQDKSSQSLGIVGFVMGYCTETLK